MSNAEYISTSISLLPQSQQQQQQQQQKKKNHHQQEEEEEEEQQQQQHHRQWQSEIVHIVQPDKHINLSLVRTQREV